MAKYPGQIDNSGSLPPAVDNSTPVSASIFNKLREAVIAIESELGTKPAGISGTVKARLVSIEAASVILAGDLGNTNAVPYVIGLQGNPISNTSPNLRSFLRWNGAQWAPTLDVNDFDDNLFWTFDTVTPKLYQAPSYAANGQTLTIQSQYTLVDGYNGGALTLHAGNAVGPTTGAGGTINLFAGSGVTNGNINFGVDGYTAAHFISNYVGTSSLIFESTVTQSEIGQTSRSDADGADMIISAQTATGTSYSGGNITFLAGNANPSTGNLGGSVNLIAGIGNGGDGYINFKSDANSIISLILNLSTTELIISSNVAAFNIRQNISNGTGGSFWQIKGQNGGDGYDGGEILLTAGASGYGNTNGGNLILGVGEGSGTGLDGYVLFNTRDGYDVFTTALTVVPSPTGITSIIAGTDDVGFNIGQILKTSGTGAPFTVQAQSTSSGVGGKL